MKRLHNFESYRVHVALSEGGAHDEVVPVLVSVLSAQHASVLKHSEIAVVLMLRVRTKPLHWNIFLKLFFPALLLLSSYLVSLLLFLALKFVLGIVFRI